MVEDEIFKASRPLKELLDDVSQFKFEQPYENYDSFNMSVVRNKCCFRNSNFRPKTNAAGKHSFVTLADIDDSITNLKRIDYRGFNVPLWDRYNGMEDPKLLIWRGNLWCLFVRPNHNISKIWMVLLNLENGESYQIDDPKNRSFTKNWMPLVKDDRLFFVTDVNPFYIYEFIDGKMSLLTFSEKRISESVVHGSSNIIQLDDRLVGIVHGRFEYAPQAWFYWTSLMSWDLEWKSQRLGRPFYFEDKQIEFCLSWELIGNKIRIPYSVNDCSLSMVEFDKKGLVSLL